MEPAKCQSIYWCLLDMLAMKKGSPADYIRVWETTSRCDQFTDLSEQRAAIRNHLEQNNAQGVHTRILNFDETPVDNSRALQTRLHYRDWHSKCLSRALNFNNRLYYYTLYTLACLRLDHCSKRIQY